MPLTQIETQIRLAIESVPGAIEGAFYQVISKGRIPIEGEEITRAIQLRLQAYYQSQKRIKEFLGKRYIGAGSDFFVETVVFYLKALVRTYGLEMEVASERPTKRKQKALRPDISIWRGDRLLAAIECKTQLGWDRKHWETDFEKRESRLATEHPGCCTYLLVMTLANWPGFGDNIKTGTKYFVLYNKWPTNNDTEIVTPIEGLFRQIRALR